MSGRDALIVLLSQQADAPPLWMRVVDGGIVQRGTGTDWLSATGLRTLPTDNLTMLVVPIEATALHWIAMPNLPVRQGRAAARLAALDASIGQADTMIAVTDQQDDPATAHLVAIAARADVQHWLLWAQHHGLDPDVVMPSALLLPDPSEGFVHGMVGDVALLRGPDIALAADDPIAPAITNDAPVRELSAEAMTQAIVAALDKPAINLRQGDFAKRTRMMVDGRQIARIAMWCGCIALVSLMIALIAIIKMNAAADRLDADSVMTARKIAPNVHDAIEAEQYVNAQLALLGSGAYGFTGTTAGLFAVMRNAPTVELTLLDRGQDGVVKATLAATKADDIIAVVQALQASGFTITATSLQDPGGRVVANIMVQP